MRSVLFASIVALIAVGCGGESSDEEKENTGATATGTTAVSLEVVPTGLAFVDTSMGSTLAISVAPNEAGIDWVDLGLTDEQITSIVIASGDQRARMTIDGADFYLAGDGVSAWGRLGGSEVVVVTAAGVSVVAVEAARSQAPMPSWADGWQPVALLGGRSATSVDAQASLEYMVDRPLVVSQSAEVAVSATVDGAVVDPVTLTGFGLLVEGCAAGPSSMGGPAQASCAPASASRVVVTAEVPLPPADTWKESQIGIFASRERCEAWAGLNGNVGSLVNWLGYGLATAVGEVEPRAGVLMSGVTALLGQVFSTTGGVSCGTITVADELIEEFTSANTDVAVQVSVSGDSFEYAFAPARVEVFPFAGGPASSLVLVGTAHDVASLPNDPPTAAELAPFDGTYRGTLNLVEVGDGGRKVREEAVLVIEDGIVVGFDGVERVEDTPTETGPNGVLCRSDVTFEFSLIADVQLVGGVGEGTITYTSEQSAGRLTGLSPTFVCDADLEGRFTTPLFVNFAVQDGVATVGFLAEDRVVTTLTLAAE